MKLYIQDLGWAGSIVAVAVAIANSREEAIILMESAQNYDDEVPIREEEIKNGFIFANLGDM